MATFPTHGQLQDEGTWLAYILGGLSGVAELMARAGTSSGSCVALQESAAWAIHSLADKQQGSNETGYIDWPEADAIVRLLLEALRMPHATLELRTVCCKTLRMLLHQYPNRSQIFFQNGGAAAIIDTLRLGGATAATGDPNGCKLLMVAARLMTCVVDGNAPAVQALQEHGALQALVESGFGQGSDDAVLYEVLWAVGQIGGVCAILEVMMRMQGNERVLKRCLAVFAKQLWRPEDVDVERLPPVLEKLVKITDHFLQAPSSSCTFLA